MTNLETTTSETSRIRASPLGGFRAVLPGGALASTHGVSSILASTVTGTATATVQPHTSGLPPRFDEDVNISLVKVVVLGAPGVGKTSIVKVREAIDLIGRRLPLHEKCFEIVTSCVFTADRNIFIANRCIADSV